jgi:hypothetical protein
MIQSANGRFVASAGGYTTNSDNGEHVLENESNAEFIVRACNAHDDLLAALERYMSKGLRGITIADYDIARAAIAKAKGGAS